MPKVQIKIEYDRHAESPREWSNIGTIVAWHRGYTLGDEQAFENLQELVSDQSSIDTTDWAPSDYQRWLVKNDYLILPVYLYDHSGITINTTGFHCPWDSGQVGFIYVSKEDVRKEYGVKRISPKLKELVFDVLRSEISTYSQYLEGDVYGYSLQKVRKDGSVKKELDSCWGFYGADIQENGMLDHIPSKYHDAPVVGIC